MTSGHTIGVGCRAVRSERERARGAASESASAAREWSLVFTHVKVLHDMTCNQIGYSFLSVALYGFRQTKLVLSTFIAASAAIASAPAPPMNLPPWQPGMAPPVPGPVFSKAFNALLVLLGMITAKSLRALVQVSSTSVADIFPLLFAS